MPIPSVSTFRPPTTTTPADAPPVGTEVAQAPPQSAVRKSVPTASPPSAEKFEGVASQLAPNNGRAQMSAEAQLHGAAAQMSDAKAKLAGLAVQVGERSKEQRIGGFAEVTVNALASSGGTDMDARIGAALQSAVDELLAYQAGKIDLSPEQALALGVRMQVLQELAGPRTAEAPPASDPLTFGQPQLDKKDDASKAGDSLTFGQPQLDKKDDASKASDSLSFGKPQLDKKPSRWDPRTCPWEHNCSP